MGEHAIIDHQIIVGGQTACGPANSSEGFISFVGLEISHPSLTSGSQG